MEESRGCVGGCFSLGCSVIGTVISIVFGIVVVGISIYLETASVSDAPTAQPEPAPSEAPAPGRRRNR